MFFEMEEPVFSCPDEGCHKKLTYDNAICFRARTKDSRNVLMNATTELSVDDGSASVQKFTKNKFNEY